MMLTGPQRRQLHDALLSAFPAEGALSRMLSFQLNQNLTAITGGRGLSQQVLDLIVWAESQGRIDELVAGARATVPGNAELRAVADAMTGAAAPSPSAPSTAAAPAPVVNTAALRNALTRAFNTEELQTLCADLEQELANRGVALAVSLEMVGGTTKPMQVLNLVGYVQRRGHLDVLIEVARATRPGLI
jgi:hypothetical protein